MNISKSEQVRQLKRTDPTLTIAQLANKVGVTWATAAQAFKHSPEEPAAVAASPDPAHLVPVAARLLRKGSMTPAALAAALGIDVGTSLEALLKLLEEHHNLDTHGTLLSLERPDFGHIPITMIDPSVGWTSVGILGDTHLACKEERLDALHGVYDLYAEEAIDHVFHAGNIVDGYVERINGASVHCSTVDDQIQYVVDNYPARKGITTHFITGDDHEGWWIKEGINFGKMLEYVAKEQGRTDLHYLGHVEADVAFTSPAGHTSIMKVQHPGGGSAYARSYTGQKQVEAFQGGEKPQILVQGHYHVSNFMIERNVYVVSLPGFQDQTVFARKKRLRMEVGGAILQFKQSPLDSSVARLRIEFKEFFDRGYYKPFLRSDTKLVKGHLELPTATK